MPQPACSKYLVLAAQDTVARLLRERGLHHLKVTSRGPHVVVYSEEPDGEKVSRIRFCAVGHDQFRTLPPTPAVGSLRPTKALCHSSATQP